MRGTHGGLSPHSKLPSLTKLAAGVGAQPGGVEVMVGLHEHAEL